MRVLSAFSRAARDVASVLLPPVCAVCECELPAPHESLVCGVCWARLQRLPHPLCDRCGHPVTSAACHWCMLLPSYVRSARSVCWMPDGTAGPIVHAFKYDGWYRLAGELARRIGQLSWPDDVRREWRGIVPVPLSASRLRERGYDQCRLLADALAPQWNVPVYDRLLDRPVATRAQARLTPEERLHNVAHAFRVNDVPSHLRDAHLVLVDDVVTTSATLNACAAALFDSGVRAVSYVTFGRARSLGDVLT